MSSPKPTSSTSSFDPNSWSSAVLPSRYSEAAADAIDSGAFFEELATLVAYHSTSTPTIDTLALKAYLQEMIVPRLEALGCSVTEYELGATPILIGHRHESDDVPTVLMYAHGDVVTGLEGRWSDDLGLLADRVGRLKVMFPAAAAIGLVIVPLFIWVNRAPTFATLAIVMTILGLLKSLYFGALPSVMSDVFPPEARATGLAFSYNVTTSVFGGFTPTIATALVGLTGSNIAPAYYLLCLAIVSICALFAAAKKRSLR